MPSYFKMKGEMAASEDGRMVVVRCLHLVVHGQESTSANAPKCFPLLDTFPRFLMVFRLHAILQPHTRQKTLESQKVCLIVSCFLASQSQMLAKKKKK